MAGPWTLSSVPRGRPRGRCSSRSPEWDRRPRTFGSASSPDATRCPSTHTSHGSPVVGTSCGPRLRMRKRLPCSSRRFHRGGDEADISLSSSSVAKYAKLVARDARSAPCTDGAMPTLSARDRTTRRNAPEHGRWPRPDCRNRPPPIDECGHPTRLLVDGIDPRSRAKMVAHLFSAHCRP